MPASIPDNSRLLNEVQLQEFILRELGAPQLQVSLTQEDLTQAIDQSKRWFSAKKGAKKFVLMPTFSGTTAYELPVDVDIVIDVAFPSGAMDFSTLIDPLRLLDVTVPYNLFPSPSSGGMLSSYAQALQYLELARRVTGAEVEWGQDGRTLFVFPIPRTTGNILVYYKSNRFTIDQLSERDHDLVKRFSLAWAKRKLGRTRSKYDNYPGAQGTVGVDGVRLLDEAKEEFAALEDEIAQSGFPLGFLTG